METSIRSLTPRRLRNTLCVTLLIAAGIVARGLVVSSHAITGVGSAYGEDDVSGSVVNSAAGPTPRPTPLCQGPCSLEVDRSEYFDNVAPPTLPPDWLATNTLGPPPLWVTSNSGLPMPPAETLPNAAFVDDPGVVSDKRLDSLHIQISGRSPQLFFQHNFNLEASEVDPNVGFDGGVLEISFDGGNTFQDILGAGGSFVIGGYNRTISTDRDSPIAGRAAWSGNSQGFIAAMVNLPFRGVSVVLRWRMASDNNGSGEGWRVDNVNIRWCEPVPCQPPTPRPRPTPAPRPVPSHRQALTLRPDILRYRAQARDSR
jgi:hypothetical protein